MMYNSLSFFYLFLIIYCLLLITIYYLLLYIFYCSLCIICYTLFLIYYELFIIYQVSLIPRFFISFFLIFFRICVLTTTAEIAKKGENGKVALHHRGDINILLCGDPGKSNLIFVFFLDGSRTLNH